MSSLPLCMEYTWVPEVMHMHCMDVAVMRRPAYPDSAALLQDDEDEEAGWREPCSECGRRYYHEHVRAVHGSEASGTDDEIS